MPAFSARNPAAWIAGPSAIGSVKGMPISMMSAPAFGSALMISSEVAGSGSPAIRKVTKAGAAFALQLGEACIDAGGHELSFAPQDIGDLRNVLVAAAGEIDTIR